MMIPPETGFGKEVWRWEHTTAESNPHDNSIKGMRPVEFQPYPAMMYRPLQKNPWRFDDALAHSEAEQRNLESLGYVAGGKGAAAEHFDRMQQEIAVLAAARNYEDRNMSDKAKAEIAVVEESSSTHTAEIPQTPIKPRSR